jgi:N-acetylglucosamine-6-phosphate deacetylase
MVTLSPHFEGSNEYIAALVSRGVHVSIGHTHASQVQIEQAVDAGARLSTHLGNGIAPLLDRHPNPIWSQLADDRLTASFIADGHHLPAETLKAMVKAKGLDRSILVSDAVALAGMPAGSYTAPVGGRVVLSDDGRLSMEGTSTLAGAVIPLSECVGRAVRMTSRSLADILSMATINPGRFVGDRGVLQVGGRADIFRFRWSDRVEVADVWLAGQLMHQA